MLIDKTAINRSALQDKVAVITGAGQGIGKETARILAHLGACVVIAEINDTGRETEALIRQEGGRALFVRTDVADAESMHVLHRRVSETFGPVSILANNAEATGLKAVLDLSVEEWDRVLDVNLRGAFLGIKEFLPEMLARKDGIVITFESAEGMPYMSAYLASKVGLRSLALSVAQEVGDESGVSVYCFGPGMVETPGAVAAFKHLAPLYHLTLEEFIKQSAPGGKLMSAELCATGLVGTILHAKEFHGEGDAGYVLGLSKLGLDPEGELWKTQIAPEPMPAPTVQEQIRNEASPRARALTLNRQLEEILETNIREYETLSRFQRPIIKRMFAQGTGLKVEDWLASAQEMTKRLQGGGAIGPAPLQQYGGQLKRLTAFITKQESDARGWIKDPAQLHVALEALQQRKETTTRLEASLVEMERAERG